MTPLQVDEREVEITAMRAQGEGIGVRTLQG